jgi:hypothetical protein
MATLNEKVLESSMPTIAGNLNGPVERLLFCRMLSITHASFSATRQLYLLPESQAADTDLLPCFLSKH